eukprot:6321380-Alexandrium_andersonii.AAC.1
MPPREVGARVDRHGLVTLQPRGVVYRARPVRQVPGHLQQGRPVLGGGARHAATAFLGSKAQICPI